MGLKESKSADYITTGSWSAKAAKEATKYGKVNLVLPKVDKYTSKYSPLLSFLLAKYVGREARVLTL